MPKLFLLWLAAFYLVWLTIVAVGSWAATIASHWPIALTMAAGSYVAGATPMGGGTVAFPFLVLLQDHPGGMGRHFALAIQSVGMVSATVAIVANRTPVAWHLIRYVILAAIPGTIIGLTVIAPIVPDLSVKLVFSVVWCSFGLLHLMRMKSLLRATGMQRGPIWLERRLGLLTGLLGGIVASITGVGIDMLLYSVLVLAFRADLRLAIPSSVVVMAGTSVVGIVTSIVLSVMFPGRYPIHPEVWPNWLTAAPIAILGAPFGAWVVNRVSRRPTLIFVSSLCIAQFLWTVYHERLTIGPLLFALLAVGLVNVALLQLTRTQSIARPVVSLDETAAQSQPES